MTDDDRTIHYDDLPCADVDVLIALPHAELEAHIRDTRAFMDNAQMIHDRLRSVRMEKIRRDCAARSKAGGQ